MLDAGSTDEVMVRTNAAKLTTSSCIFVCRSDFHYDITKHAHGITLVALVTVHSNGGMRKNFCASNAGKKEPNKNKIYKMNSNEH